MPQRIIQTQSKLVTCHLTRTLRPTLNPFISKQLRFSTSSTSSNKQNQVTSVSQEDGMRILINQRLHRPVAPHLSIYRPQITAVLSALNRITGVALSGSLYLFGTAYLAAPVFGWQITSTALATGFAKWPMLVQIGAKLVAVLPFTFHSFNGLRHLIWDTGKALTNPQVIKTGWTVVTLSILSSLGLALFA